MYEIKNIGSRLENERKRLGLTALKVYENLNVAQTTYKNYEAGKRNIPASLLARLWDMGFDILFIVTGVYTDPSSIDTEPSVSSPQVVQSRLVHLPDNIDGSALSDKLLMYMHEVEDALIQAGAKPKKDYNYQDLLIAASQFS